LPSKFASTIASRLVILAAVFFPLAFAAVFAFVVFVTFGASGVGDGASVLRFLDLGPGLFLFLFARGLAGLIGRKRCGKGKEGAGWGSR
jgi:hypothetical protein